MQWGGYGIILGAECLHVVLFGNKNKIKKPAKVFDVPAGF